ncbi:sensor histidine kinase, partial [Glutamicibacter arilaitensis]
APVGFRLSNPILNCARHSKIVLSVASTPKAIEIQIQDHGAGMSEAELARAGERFWRAEHVRQSPGTGLGLAIVDRLARANNGELILASVAGAGLKASIILPRAEQHKAVSHDS